MNKICFGCGAKLQSIDERAQGYIPESKMETSEYCQRCFRMIHYGEVKKADKPKSTKAIIDTVNKHANLVIFMVDFVDIYDEIIDIYRSVKVPKILVVSKSDIIPKNVSFTTIQNYLRKVYGVKEDIMFVSMMSNLNSLIKVLHGQDNVYFLGLTNSGKSTIINKLAEKFDSKMAPITTSFKENTTLDFLRVKVDGRTFVDSPGFVSDGYEVDKSSRITSEIHPITYQNKTKCTYKIGVEFEVSVKGNSNVILYFSNNIKIERFYKREVEGTTFQVSGNSDIVISGLGFIKTTDDIEITIPARVMKYVNIRPSLVGGNFE